jgi:hypothetical protein
MMRDVSRYTKGFVLVAIILIALYDIWAYSAGGTKSTISWLMYTWSHEHPAFSFAMGFVMGHLFWQMKKVEA